MTRISKIALLALAGIVLLPWATGTLQANDLQPRYAHALGQLRMARTLLQGASGAPTPDEGEVLAVRGIDSAMAAIQGASTTRAKGLDERLSIDKRLSSRERLLRALDQLDQAEENMEKEEAQSASALNREVIQQIELARKRLNAASNLVDLSDYRCEPDLPCVASPSQAR